MTAPVPQPLSRAAPRAHRWRVAWGYALVLAAPLLAFGPAWKAGLIWDDGAHLTRPALRSLPGLARIWGEPGATQQYYPVLHSAFWLEHRIWGDAPGCYHALNILLHAGAALLLLRLLRNLGVPGALFAALLFAVHPVAVETVAWVSEQKNTLSTVFYLLAALAYLRFDQRRRGWDYALATGCFVLALLSKSVSATLPAALLVICWWRRGRLDLRRDIVPLAPWLALSLGAGIVTAWMEHAHVGAHGAAFAFGFAARLQIAGHAVCFYLGKLLWPSPLIFMYPRWDPEAGSWFYPATVLLALAALWALRRRSRGPLALALLFIGTLFPALGFINVFPFLYSFVADHFQYLASAAIFAGFAAGTTLLLAARPPLLRAVAAGAVVVVLGLLTWRQCRDYADVETLWRATLGRNPASWMAHTNLGSELLRQQRLAEAESELEIALAQAPNNGPAHGNLGEVRYLQGRPREAAAEYQRALELDPGDAPVQGNLGAVLLELGDVKGAEQHYRLALAGEPDSASAHTGLGIALLRQGQLEAATAEFQAAVTADPANAPAANNLGAALMQAGRRDQAQAAFAQAVAANPRFLPGQVNLAKALLQAGKPREAIPHFQAALALKPGSTQLLGPLGYAYVEAGQYSEAVQVLKEALRIDPRDADALANLRAAQAHLP